METAQQGIFSAYAEQFVGNEWIALEALLPEQPCALPRELYLDLTDAERTRRARLGWKHIAVPLRIDRSWELQHVRGDYPVNVVTSLELIAAIGGLLGIKSPLDDDPDWGMGRGRQMRCWQRAIRQAEAVLSISENQ